MKIGSTEKVVLPEGVTPEYVLGEDGTPVGNKFPNANAPAGTEVLRMEVEPVRGVAIVGHHVEVFTQTFDEGMTREEIAR
jgi:hypothetical protein